MPKAVWLGVYPSEIRKLDIASLPLTRRDKLIIRRLLESPCVVDSENNEKLVEELKIMLERDHKAEIEGLMRNNTFLSESYLPMKFYSLYSNSKK